jgi:hypothetical protein
MSTPRYLLVGAASELSLRSLADELRRRDVPVALVDLAQEPVVPSNLPPGDGPLVLVTSQHLAMTGQVYDSYSAITTHVRSPQALRMAVGADLLVFVPHDLADPVLDWEVPFLPLLDLFVAPDDSWWWVAEHVPVVVAGWVGSVGAERVAVPASVVERGILFVSAVNWIKSCGGGRFLVDSLRSTLACGLPVKLPDWPGTEELEKSLRDAGAEVLDARLPASALIRSAPVVVTTASGSIVAEASLAGHRPICVLPPGGEAVFGKDLALYDVVVCSDDDITRAVPRAGVVRPGFGPFDLDLFLTAISEKLGSLPRD